MSAEQGRIKASMDAILACGEQKTRSGLGLRAFALLDEKGRSSSQKFNDNDEVSWFVKRVTSYRTGGRWPCVDMVIVAKLGDGENVLYYLPDDREVLNKRESIASDVEVRTAACIIDLLEERHRVEVERLRRRDEIRLSLARYAEDYPDDTVALIPANP